MWTWCWATCGWSSESTDYVLRDTDLDGLLRQAVRKFARMFILKKITLDFRETGRTVLTDGKWLSFVVEQVLSNALKYTPAGGRIRIYGDGETLVIADSGIGIRPEDLPRVFEKGFTGYNGREDKKSTRHRGCTCAARVMAPAEPRNLHRLPPRAGDAGAAGPLPGPTGGGVTQCDETVRNRAGL